MADQVDVDAFLRKLAGSAEFLPPHKTVYDEFAANPDPTALFLLRVESYTGESQVTVVPSLTDLPGNLTGVVAIIKLAGALSDEEPLESCLHTVDLAFGDSRSYAGLYAVVHCALGPVLEAASSGTKGAAQTARQKLAELDLSISALLKHQEVQMVELQVNPIIEQADDSLESLDTAALNSLQATVNGWKRNIQKLAATERDPQSGSAQDEVTFWQGLEVALANVQSQLESAPVKQTLLLLEKGKRFHATTSFLADNGLGEAVDKVAKYNLLLKDLPLGDLLTAPDLDRIGDAVTAVFAHISKRLRVSGYPVWRCLALVEALSADLAAVLRRILADVNLLCIGGGQSDQKEFSRVVGKVGDVFALWDDNVREFTNLARDVIRKRGEKFIPVRIASRHGELQGRIEYIVAFRKRHDELLRTLESVSLQDSEVRKLAPAQQLITSYMPLTTINSLDTSTEGSARWTEAERSYEHAATVAETDVARILRSRLAVSRSASDMFRIFAMFNPLFSRPAIRGAIQEYQAQLLESVKADLSALQLRAQNRSANSPSAKAARLQDLPTVSGLIIWTTQAVRRLDQLLDRVSDILGPEWQHYADGERLYLDCQAFRTQLDPKRLVDEWVAAITRRKLSVTGPVLAAAKGSLLVNANPQVFTLFKDVRSIRALKYPIPPALSALATDSQQVYPFASRLRETVQTLYGIENRLDGQPACQSLVAAAANTVVTLVKEGLELQWQSFLGTTVDGSEAAPQFVSMLERAVSVYELRVDAALSCNVAIEEQLAQLATAPYRRSEFAAIVATIQGVADKLNVFSNVASYVEDVNQRLEAALAARCRHEISALVDSLAEPAAASAAAASDPSRVHTLGLSDQVITVDPPLETTLEHWYDRLQQTCAEIAVPLCGSSGAHGTAAAAVAAAASSDDVAAATAKFAELFTAASEYVRRWFSFQSLWDLRPEQVEKQLGSDLAGWLAVLSQVRRSRAEFNSGSAQRSFGSLQVVVSQAQTLVTAKYDSWQNALVGRFAEVVAAASAAVLADLSRVRQQLEEANVDSLDAAVATAAALAAYDTAKPSLEATRHTLQACQAALTRYRFAFPARWLFGDQIEGEASALDTIAARRRGDLDAAQLSMASATSRQLERLEHQAQSLVEQWHTNKPVSGSIKAADALFALDKFETAIRAHISSRDKLRAAAAIFNVPVTATLDLDETAKEIADFSSVWRTLAAAWDDLRALEQSEWAGLVLRKVRGELKTLVDQTLEMPARVRQYAAFQHLRTVLRERTDTFAVLTALKSDALQPRHWETLFKGPAPAPLKLGDLWSLDLAVNKQAIEEVIEHAEGEARLETFLAETQDFWAAFALELVNFHDKIHLIKNWDEVFAKADESLQALSAMHHSPHFKLVEARTLDWESRLTKLRALYDCWVDVQRQWVYLEGVFSTAELRRVLPSETAKFGAINSELFALLRMVHKTPIALEVAALPAVSETVLRLSDQLKKLQRALGEYFERQRQRFCRLYFVGDEDLLEILGEGARRAEPHLAKMFAGISAFIWDAETIIGVVSPEGERLRFDTPIETENVVEALAQVEKAAQAALLRETTAAIAALPAAWPSPSGIVEWLDRLNQATLLALKVFWTDRAASTVAQPELATELAAEYEVVLSGLATAVVDEQEPLKRKKIVQAITVLVHHHRVLGQLASDYQWERQLRYYASSDGIRVEHARASFSYGFEYQGVCEGLVMTPLVDDMFLTMTQALDARLGGSPFGPAGTGKTESVKALGQALGKFVVVFCCDESFDYNALSRLLLGVCQTGTWGCFDEFNRLNSAILSAVSGQVAAIESALVKGEPQVTLAGRTGRLEPQSALFVTMNPKYAGRSVLPENLRSHFRSFSMNKPDRDRIAEVMLYTNGFAHAEKLATAAVQLFSGLAARMSEQKHYDWGLRALKTVLNVSGTLRRSIKRPVDEADEESLVRQACYETVVPKLVAADAALYAELDAQAFSVPARTADDKSLVEAITAAASELALLATPEFVDKALQINRFLAVNAGLMLVGAAATGKSSALKTLAKALGDVELYVIDPKIMPKSALFGSLDPITREWTDGLVTQILRRVLENLRGENRRQHWIVFDGDVDPEWAENLNSVLDDNRLLTLPNGERLPLAANMRVIFEVSDLAAATPATISRCGMIWFNSVGIKVLADAALANADARFAAALELDFAAICEAATELPHVMPFTATRSLCSLAALLQAAANHATATSPPEYFASSVLLALVWAFAGDCDTASRDKFIAYLQNLPVFASAPPNLLDFDVSPISGHWRPLQDSLDEVDLEPAAVVQADLVIPTIDTVRHDQLIYGLLSAHTPVVLCGPPGGGKTMTLLSAVRRHEGLELISLNFSKTTNDTHVLRALEERMVYARTANGTELRPMALGQRIVLFCDEINLPALDKYGGQPAISLLRSLIEFSGFWRRGEWVTLERVQIVGACNPPSDIGRFELSQRFLRHCSVIYVDYPTQAALDRIYERMVSALLKCVPGLRGHSQAVTSAMIAVYNQSRQEFGNCAAHYIYSPRELTRWCRGLYSAIKDHFDMGYDELVSLWAHEALRLFSDRLNTSQERDWTWKLISDTAEAILHQPVKQPLLYSNWLTKKYTRVERQQLRDFVTARLAVFSDEVVDTKLVLFDDLLDHALRIDRVLRQPQGHLILLGASSSGKTSLTRFVCWMNGISLERLQAFTGYSDSDFATDLRRVLVRSGCRGERVCFLLDESALLESSVLEKMNTLLANGEVPGLFEDEDYTQLLNTCREGAQKLGLSITDDDDLLKWFNRQVQANLHVVFTISASASSVAQSSIASPALFNRCVLNVMGDWSQSDLAQVARSETQLLDVDHHAVESAACAVHAAAVAPNAAAGLETTPGEYMRFLKLFVQLYSAKKAAMVAEQSHFHIGIEKLKGTMLEVRQLRSQLATKQQDLSVKDSQAKQTLKSMLNDQSEAERKREASITIRAAVEEQNFELRKRREQVYADLAQAEPAVLAARQGVSAIKKQHLNELRAFNSPPEAVKVALEAVVVLLGNSPPANWRELLHIVRAEDFIPSIVNFDTESLSAKTIRFITQRYMKLPTFNYEAVNRASKACGPLFEWVKAQIDYATTLAQVEPLKQEVEVLEGKSRQQEAQLAAATEMIGELEASIAGYEAEYAALIAEAQTIKAELAGVSTKIDRSMELVASLQSEQERWSKSVKAFAGHRDLLLGNCLYAAAFLSYSGGIDSRSRRELADAWLYELQARNIQFQDDLDVMAYLSPASERLQWRENGLASDALTIENAVIVQQAIKVPLVIDPAGRAAAFFAAQFPNRVTTTFLDPAFMNHLENAMRFGTPLIVENAEIINPVVLPLLNKEYIKRGGRTLVVIGRQEIDVSPAFKLVLVTADPAATYSSTITSRTSVVNFTITRNSLERIALDETVAVNRPDLEQRRTQLIKLQGEYRVRLHTLEEGLLQVLSDSQGDLLENQQVIDALERLKAEAREVSVNSTEADSAMAEISATTETFAAVYVAAGRAFALLNTLHLLKRDYQFSLSFFMAAFRKALVPGKTADEMALAIYQQIYARAAPALVELDRVVLLAAMLALYDDSDLSASASLAAAEKATKEIYIQEIHAAGKRVLNISQIDSWSDIISQQVDASVPVLFGMSNADPTLRVQVLADSQAAELTVVPLGSSEGIQLAETAIERAARLGQWVLVQNLHMAPQWMETLMQTVKRLKNANPKFRLLATVQLGSPAVPVPLLRQSRLLVCERPAGMRAALEECLEVVKSTALEKIPVERAKLLLGVAWLHAVVVERLQLDTVGWRDGPYGFSDADLSSAADVVDKWLQPLANRTNVDPSTLPWEAITDLLTTTIYGAKVDNQDDNSDVQQLAKHLFSGKMFDSGFMYTADVTGTAAPEDSSVASVKTWISKIPQSQPATWLGLDAGANTTKRELDADTVREHTTLMMDALGY